MATIAGIRDGLQTRLATISGLRAKDVRPDQPIPPCAWTRYVGPVQEGAYATLGGDSYDEFEIVLIVADAAGKAKAIDALDAYLAKSGASSVQAAVEGDEGLAATVDFALWMGWTDVGDIEENGLDYLGARGRVRVWH